jgi:hypothetical protein
MMIIEIPENLLYITGEITIHLKITKKFERSKGGWRLERKNIHIFSEKNSYVFRKNWYLM